MHLVRCTSYHFFTRSAIPLYLYFSLVSNSCLQHAGTLPYHTCPTCSISPRLRSIYFKQYYCNVSTSILMSALLRLTIVSPNSHLHMFELRATKKHLLRFLHVHFNILSAMFRGFHSVPRFRFAFVFSSDPMTALRGNLSAHDIYCTCTYIRIFLHYLGFRQTHRAYFSIFSIKCYYGFHEDACFTIW
jgi:hypothetical protein